MSILLVDDLQHSSVVGHAKICKLPNMKEGCWVESGTLKNQDLKLDPKYNVQKSLCWSKLL